MSNTPSPITSASVRNILALLSSRDAHLVAGRAGLDRRVTWASRMRARLPAFESLRGGELVLLLLSQLRQRDETLAHLLKTLHQEGIAVVAVAAPSREALGDDAYSIADQLHLPLILLPLSASLEEIEREVITFVVSFRGEIERKATEVSHQLMQLSAQGVGLSGVCTHLARSCNKWVIVQDAHYHIRLQVPPPTTTLSALGALPLLLTDEALRQQGLARVMVPILVRHDAVGYLSLLGTDGDFDHLERLLLNQVAPILALEFIRERERSEVESRYQAEAFMDVLQGQYQQPEEMLARARLLGYDLTPPQVVVIFEISPDEPDYEYNPPDERTFTQWSKSIHEDVLRVWPTCWVMSDARRLTALIPLSFPEPLKENKQTHEDVIFARLERIHTRVQAGTGSAIDLPVYSIGLGRSATTLQAISQSFREAQQALLIGRQLFGPGKLHSFAHLGIYRLLFHLHGHVELSDFYQETLGPLLGRNAHGDETLLETLEGYFRCNGNLSETARSMHLHRNSLLYRLGRVEELLGRPLEDPEVRLSLQIALKIRQLLKQGR